MPNNVTNHLSIIGPDIDKFAELVCEIPPAPLPSGVVAFENNESKEILLSFNAVVPLGPEYERNTYDPYGYNLEQELWGVKWGAYDVFRDYVQGKSLMYKFNTAYSASIVWTEKASKKFPNSYFYLSWGGEGPTSGRMIFKNGATLCSDAPSYEQLVEKGLYFKGVWPSNLSDEEEEALFEQENIVTNRFLLAHGNWTSGHDTSDVGSKE